MMSDEGFYGRLCFQCETESRLSAEESLDVIAKGISERYLFDEK